MFALGLTFWLKKNCNAIGYRQLKFKMLEGNVRMVISILRVKHLLSDYQSKMYEQKM